MKNRLKKMTAFHGGKQKYGKQVAVAIKATSELLEMEPEGYWEPFCGMLGVYQHVVPLFPDVKKWYASDMHKSLILMWKAIVKGWKPPVFVSETEWQKLKNSPQPSAAKAYAGFGFSFSGIFFSGYCGKYEKCEGKPKYPNKLSRIGEIVSKVKFSSGEYNEIHKGVKNFIIYCDPPYQSTKENRYYDETLKLQKFDHSSFWEWCRKMSKHNLVLVSNFTAPSDFVELDSDKRRIFNHRQYRDYTEKIFVHETKIATINGL